MTQPEPVECGRPDCSVPVPGRISTRFRPLPSGQPMINERPSGFVRPEKRRLCQDPMLACRRSLPSRDRHRRRGGRRTACTGARARRWLGEEYFCLKVQSCVRLQRGITSTEGRQPETTVSCLVGAVGGVWGGQIFLCSWWFHPFTIGK